MKVIRIQTPDGEYTLPLIKVAEHRADEYEDRQLRPTDWKEEIDFESQRCEKIEFQVFSCLGPIKMMNFINNLGKNYF